MQNRLAEHLTTWKLWYAIPAAAAPLVASLLPAIGGMFVDPGSPSAASTMAFLTPLQFIAFAALASASSPCSRRGGRRPATSA